MTKTLRAFEITADLFGTALWNLYTMVSTFGPAPPESVSPLSA